MTVVTLVLTGLVYPLLVTGVAQVALPAPGERQPGRRATAGVVGSELIGQGFASPGYFQPRPSAAGADGYDAAASSRLEPRARPRRSCATASPPTSRACGRRTRRPRARCPSSS